MRLLLAFFLSLLLVVSGRAQERVHNVRIRVVDSSQLEIRYDLINVRPGDSIYVKMESRLRGELRTLPEFIRGDIGKQVTVGSDRRIVWDALANGYSLDEDIRATILVKSGPSMTLNPPIAAQKPVTTSTTPTSAQSTDPEMPVVSKPAETNRATALTDSVRSRKTRYAGPAWALLSAVAPGMGNIFVQLPKPKIGFRPLVLVGCYGLVAYGLAERKKSRDEYAIYEQQKNMTDAEPYYQRANSHHQNYFLATRGAVIVAAVDVALTFIKGLRNNRLQNETPRFSSVTLRPGIQAGQPTAVIHYSF